MAEGGFDDLEMKDINEQKEEEYEVDNERRNEETSFINDDELAWSPRSNDNNINIINTSNPKIKYSRVDNSDYIHDVNKDAGSIRKSLTNDKKKSFKKIFKVNLEKKMV